MTFPNHYSIATGLYAEHHGIVNNRFFDPARNQTYSMSDRNAVEDGSWYGGEPIWVTAEKQGMVAASFFWVGSEADVQGIRPTYWNRYSDSVPHEARVDTVLKWLQMPVEKRPHMITCYFSDVDSAGHRTGPASNRVAESITRVDQALGRLKAGIDQLPIRDQIHLILVSDHGMVETSPNSFVDVSSVINAENVQCTESGPNLNLFVSGGDQKIQEVIATLKSLVPADKGTVYARANIPDELHYKNNPRIGDIVVIMKQPLLATDHPPQRSGGSHGWDPANPEMHGIFLAMGPGITPGRIIPSFVNVDIYPLITEILGLEPAPTIDGQPKRLAAALRESEPAPANTP